MKTFVVCRLAGTAALLVVVASWFVPRPAIAGGVVGTGTPSSCTESALWSALYGGGSVTFNCGPNPATITFTNPNTTVIAANTSIDGGSLITIDGGGVTNFQVNAGVRLALANLTISDCRGSAIVNYGALTVNNCTFSNNTSSAGGAIFNVGAWLTSASTLTVTNSTFANNSVTGSGGAILSQGCGWRGRLVICKRGQTVTVTNSTFVGNSANFGGAIVQYLGKLTVTSSTFDGNSASSAGGAIYNADGCPVGCVTLKDTIVTNSTSGGNCAAVSGNAVKDGGRNLDDGTTCALSSLRHSLSNTNPLLDPAGLANNGGPTETVAVEAGSPAINAAPCLQRTDQRGYKRPGAGSKRCTIGAYEYNATP